MFGPFGWWFGRREIREIDAGLRLANGRRKARIGKVLGAIGTVVWGLIVAFIVVGALTTDELLNEDFNSDSIAFSTDSDRFVDLSVEDGMYRILIKDPQVPQIVRSVFPFSKGALRIDTTATHSTDGEGLSLFGVGCWNGDSAYLLVVIDDTGLSLLETVSESTGDRRPLTDPISTTALRPVGQPNDLRLDCVGGGREPTGITGWVNGEAAVSVAIPEGLDSFNAVGFWVASTLSGDVFNIDEIRAVTDSPAPPIDPVPPLGNSR